MKKIHQKFKKLNILALTIIFFAISMALFLYKDYVAKGATYGFIQSTWAGGQTANNATHPTNKTNWTEYSAKDANLTAGTTLTLTPSTSATTHTLDADFTTGSGTGITISGDGVRLDQ